MGTEPSKAGDLTHAHRVCLARLVEGSMHVQVTDVVAIITAVTALVSAVGALVHSIQTRKQVAPPNVPPG